MRYLIEHETVLEYAQPIREHHIELRLAPRHDAHQTVLSCLLESEPAAEMGNYTDYFGNRVDYFTLSNPHNRLLTRLRAEVETRRENPFGFDQVAVDSQKEWLRDALRRTPPLYDFVLHRSLVTPTTARLAESLSGPLPEFSWGRPVMESLLELMAWIPSVLAYRTGATGVHAELTAALSRGEGVCQDFAHLFITLARSWDIPARYVMGYLDPGIDEGGEQMATHAWAEALVPGGGWIGFDATHNLLANDRYVAIAFGRDSYDAAPQRGSFKGPASAEPPQVRVSMQEQ